MKLSIHVTCRLRQDVDAPVASLTAKRCSLPEVGMIRVFLAIACMPMIALRIFLVRFCLQLLTADHRCVAFFNHGSACTALSLSLCFFVADTLSTAANDFQDRQADRDSLPTVPEGFEVTVFAQEPIVRQPCSMAFDARGRLFVGMGPQYRKPTPQTPGDSVVILSDTTGDGRADTKKVFATGFNAVQALAWHGNELWVANAPDLTVVRDLDGDDEADEYVRLYTDLGNLEHGLHGLNWAPDGKLYMSKGNSKGLTLPDRLAPKPFRELWGVASPDDAPDMPEPKVFSTENYQRSFHDPNDDWGLDGGVLRCDADGTNLEIVARGFRNPWDITMDSQFNWLGTDNDQTGGDRIIMPFYGAHFGWNHPWSAHWSPEPHAPSAPVSGPLFEGSGTGIVFGDGLDFPARYRKAFFINDWLNKTTYVWRPKWEGALMRPASGAWEPFIVGGDSLFRPTDIEAGPDGALWVLGWSRGYGAEWKNGKLTNEGRVYRVARKNASEVEVAGPGVALSNRNVQQLVQQFASPLPVHRIDAQDELVQRGNGIVQELLEILESKSIAETKQAEMLQTWTLWTLGRIAINQASQDQVNLDQVFEKILARDNSDHERLVFNQRLQAIRILAFRSREAKVSRSLPVCVIEALKDPDSRIRFEAVQALIQTKQNQHVPKLLDLLSQEQDPAIYYIGWRTLQTLCSVEELRRYQTDKRDAVRRGALLALLETHELTESDMRVALKDSNEDNREIASAWLAKVASGGEKLIVKGRPLDGNADLRMPDSRQPASERATSPVAVISNIRSKSKKNYRLQPSGLVHGALVYSDRRYRVRELSDDLLGSDFIQTANDDDTSSGDEWLSFDSPVPLRVMVAVDKRLPDPPAWIRETYSKTDQHLVTDDCTMRIYSREYPAGHIILGGNTDAKRKSPCANYVVLLQPQLLKERKETGSRSKLVESTLGLLEKGDAWRGEILFKHTSGAGCIKCHRLNEGNGGFAPNLGRVGSRASARHLAESMIEPDAVITEGFQQLSVLTDDGRVHVGVLIEESGLSLTLGLVDGNQLVLPKSAIEQRKSRPVSAMPSMAPILSLQQLADLTAYLITLREEQTSERRASRKNKKLREKRQAAQNPPEAAVMKSPQLQKGHADGFTFIQQQDRLQIFNGGNSLAEYVFRDATVLRPYFANLKTLSGLQVTRNFPPIPGKDAMDHATMHPGLWLAFGDVNGADFWRNRGTIKHRRFMMQPEVKEGRLKFSTESELLSPDNDLICTVLNRFVVQAKGTEWSLIWDATFESAKGEIHFGDQEEMGFGARVATPLTEKNGGVILSSAGERTARATWGQPAAWCDYSGLIGDTHVGITLMTSPDNFRNSWWHNRNYGVFVANPFGRAAMKQGKKSTVSVDKGKSFRIVFGASIHETKNNVLEQNYQRFVDELGQE